MALILLALYYYREGTHNPAIIHRNHLVSSSMQANCLTINDILSYYHFTFAIYFGFTSPFVLLGVPALSDELKFGLYMLFVERIRKLVESPDMAWLSFVKMPEAPGRVRVGLLVDSIYKNIFKFFSN